MTLAEVTLTVGPALSDNGKHLALVKEVLSPAKEEKCSYFPTVSYLNMLDTFQGELQAVPVHDMDTVEGGILGSGLFGERAPWMPVTAEG